MRSGGSAPFDVGEQLDAVGAVRGSTAPCSRGPSPADRRSRGRDADKAGGSTCPSPRGAARLALETLGQELPAHLHDGDELVPRQVRADGAGSRCRVARRGSSGMLPVAVGRPTRRRRARQRLTPLGCLLRFPAPRAGETEVPALARSALGHVWMTAPLRASVSWLLSWSLVICFLSGWWRWLRIIFCPSARDFRGAFFWVRARSVAAAPASPLPPPRSSGGCRAVV